MIAGFLNGECSSKAGPWPQQHRLEYQQVDHFRRGNLRRPGAAPSDGGLLSVSSRMSKPNTSRLLAEEESRNMPEDSKVIRDVKDQPRALTQLSSSGGQSVEQQQQPQQRQEQNDILVSRRRRASPASPSAGQRLGDAAAGTSEDQVGHPINAVTVTDDDVRRAYATLQSQPRRHSQKSESELTLGEYTGAEQQATRQPPAAASLLGGCDGSTNKNIAQGARLFRFNHLGSTPLVPTGAPASPSRRGMLGRTASLAQADITTAFAEGNVKATKHTTQPRARTPNGVNPNSSAPTNDTHDLATTPRVTGAPTPESADHGIVALPRGQAEEMRAARPRANGFAVPPVEPTTVKLAAGLGSWADETVEVGRLVDQCSRRMADEREGEAREEGDIRRTLEQDMGMAVKSLPLRFLKDFGYLGEAQKRGLEKTTRIMERVKAVARARAWQK